MKLEDFFIELEKYMNIPVSYYHFKDTPTIPFIAYIDTGKNTFVADGRVYTKSRNIRIELYTEKKDFNLEDKLESFFAITRPVYFVLSVKTRMDISKFIRKVSVCRLNDKCG